MNYEGIQDINNDLQLPQPEDTKVSKNPNGISIITGTGVAVPQIYFNRMTYSSTAINGLKTGAVRGRKERYANYGRAA